MVVEYLLDTITTYTYSKKLFGLSKVTIFQFCHELSLQLEEEQRIFWTHKVNIININNYYNKLSSLFINKIVYISIRFTLLKF